MSNVMVRFCVAAGTVFMVSSCSDGKPKGPTRTVDFEAIMNIEPSNIAPDCVPDASAGFFLSSFVDLTTGRNGRRTTIASVDGAQLFEDKSTQVFIQTNRIEVEIGSELCLETSSTVDGVPGFLEEGRSCLTVDESTRTLLFSLPATRGECSVEYSAFATVVDVPSDAPLSDADVSTLDDFYYGVVFDRTGYLTLRNIVPDCESYDTFTDGDEIDAEMDTRLVAETRSSDELTLVTIDDMRFVEGQELAMSMPATWLEGSEDGEVCISSYGTEENDSIDDDWLEEDSQCKTLSLEQPRVDFELNMTRDACIFNFRVGATWFGEKSADTD